jgi:hypothetical protein
MFCHVPPLGVRLQGRRVDADYVQQFVVDLLDEWYTIYQADLSPGAKRESSAGTSADSSTAAAETNASADSSESTAGEEKPAAAEDPRRQEVEEMILRYFRTWSNQDMDGYGDCFRTNACVQFIDDDGRLVTLPLGPFLASQRESHRKAAHRQTEVAESMDIRFEQKLARVVVYWKLTAGPRVEYGYDHFTLMKYKGQWKIVNLAFYVSKPEE